MLAGITTLRVFAAVDLSSDDEQRERKDAVDAIQARLEPDVYDEAVARGAAMTDDEAVTYTLAELDHILAETLPR